MSEEADEAEKAEKMSSVSNINNVWESYIDETSGETYYYNILTGQSVWNTISNHTCILDSSIQSSDRGIDVRERVVLVRT